MLKSISRYKWLKNTILNEDEQFLIHKVGNNSFVDFFFKTWVWPEPSVTPMWFGNTINYPLGERRALETRDRREFLLF